MSKKKVRYIFGSLVFVLVFAGYVGYALHLKQMRVIAEQASENEIVTRGVVDSLNQLPDTKKVENPKYDVGTKENPFLILEIVPNKAYAEFGYNISGCEPVDMQKLSCKSNYVGNLNSLSGVSLSQANNDCYFFTDEPEGNPLNYDVKPTEQYDKKTDGKYEGYYEKVKEGKGTFIQNSNGDIEKKNGGDIIWHTVNYFEKDEYIDIKFDGKGELKDIGDRIYTIREASETDFVYNVRQKYYYYRNKDNFLLDTLYMSQKEADNYSVVIKTITPRELEKSTEWITYANLITISPGSHMSGLVEVYKKMNPDCSVSKNTDTFNSEANDITWTVAEKIYNKVTAEKNYAGIVIDDTVYNNFTDTVNVTIDIKDWNLKSSGKTITKRGSKYNMYKLCIMLLSMDSKVFHRLYLDGENSAIQNGKNTLQTGDAGVYWSEYTFLLTDPNGDINTYNPYDYWGTESAWKTFGTAGEITNESFKPWVNNHVYTYKNGNSLTSLYMDQGTASCNDKTKKMFDGYIESVEEYKDKRFGTDAEIKKKKESDDKDVRDAAIAAENEKNKYSPTPSNAIRYILGVTTKSENTKTYKKNIKVLDIEPCVKLARDESSTKDNAVKPEYELTENYIKFMLPALDGKIEITHMTTAEFIGKTEDLNSTYDMIFMGLDCGAYNTSSKNIYVHSVDGGNGSWIIKELPDWNDYLVNGKIYVHTGDKMTSTEQTVNGRSRSVDFLWSDKYSGNSWEKHTTLRFPGNDITKIKKDELEDFAKSGHPIVAVPYLYNTEDALIDKNSNIYSFINENKGNGLYNAIESQKIVDALKANDVSIDFIKTPNEYEGTTDSSNNINDSSYLPKNSADQSVLKFAFKVRDESNSKYQYKIYIDQNQDGKYSDDEVYYESDEFLADEAQSYTCRLSRLFLGVVEWKIEVYNAANSSIRFVKTGCSAAKRSDGIDKKQINVLQIMPSDGSYDGKLNLKKDNTDNTFNKYYDKIQAYSINITPITADEFESWFRNDNNGKKFSFDMSAELDDSNPKNYSKTLKEKLSNYNMFIFGFGDNYGKKNISNDYGAVDYIKYFIAQGKSVLFTHDMTSMYNCNSSDFGYVANSLLRDVMGMNRYKAISKNLTAAEREQLKKYQSANKYDTVIDISGKELEEKHGFTYYAMKRLGYKSSNGEKIVYKYMIQGVDGKPLCTYGNADKTGFNNANDITTKVGRMNDGQVTSYPFKIDSEFTISKTHGQWYQLNLEDPEVTVWYSLIDDDAQNKFDSKGGGNGSPTTYAVSPYDAANNYYIYSKANVFYSGVGHSTVNNDMEARLFINTMIAAYRASYQPPVVDILNEEAELTDIDNTTYQITNAQEYDFDASSGNTVKKEDGGETKVRFSPVELNAVKTTLDCTIYYPSTSAGDEGSEKGCKYIDTIYDAKTGKEIKAEKSTDGEYVFKNLQNSHEYYFKYDWAKNGSSEEIEYSQIKFKIKNDKSKEPGYTNLNMIQGQLFELD